MSFPACPTALNLRMAEAIAANRKVNSLDTLQHFMGSSQRHAVLCGMRGEERQYFVDKMAELARVVEGMPSTGETDGRGDEAVAHLHYFAGGVGDWYITEKDKGSPDDEVPGRQDQAFGLADPFRDGGEVGYIAISELLENGGELDFHWIPKTLAEIRERKERVEVDELLEPADLKD